MSRSRGRAYERLAPEYGYTTRPETREFKADSANGYLMIAVVQSVRALLSAPLQVDQGMETHKCSLCGTVGFHRCAVAAQANRDDAKRARPPSNDESWVVADDDGLRLTFRTEDAAWRYRDEYANRLVNPTVTHEPATNVPVDQGMAKDAARLDWLDQNIFHREMDEWDRSRRPTKNMWVMFSPIGAQGSARTIIDAAIDSCISPTGAAPGVDSPDGAKR